MAILDHLKKKNQEEVVVPKPIEHLIVGEGLFAFELLHRLISENKTVHLLIEHLPSSHDFQIAGPTTLRNRDEAQALLDTLIITRPPEILETPHFFKDLKWKSFEGRSKSEKLLLNEEYFTQSGVQVEMSDLFKSLAVKEDLINNKSLYTHAGVKRIEKNEQNYRVTLTNGQLIDADFLYYGYDHTKLVDLLKHESWPSSEWLTLLEDMTSPASIVVTYDFAEPLSHMKQTYFLPLSYTHEMGHFIGEAHGTTLTWIHFFDKAETTEEDISRKVAQLKRGQEKSLTLPKIINETIVITDNSFNHAINNERLLQLYNFEETFKFIGPLAPIDKTLLHQFRQKNLEIRSPLVRGLLSIQAIDIIQG